jgi:methylphosphotriester-DNA--protein-cysteine methyltransferase
MRARTPEPALSDVLRDQFSHRDETLIRLYKHVTNLTTDGMKQDRRIAQLETNQRKLQKRLRDLEPPVAEEPTIESVRRPKRVDFVFEEG